MNDQTEYRCKKCDKLIFKSVLYCGALQVKCPRCHSIQLFETHSNLYEQEKILLFVVDENYIIEKKGGINEKLT